MKYSAKLASKNRIGVTLEPNSKMVLHFWKVQHKLIYPIEKTKDFHMTLNLSFPQVGAKTVKSLPQVCLFAWFLNDLVNN